MITSVFTTIGLRLSVSEAYLALVALNPGDSHANKKAAGALGGASRHNYIQFDSANRTWTRVR